MYRGVYGYMGSGMFGSATRQTVKKIIYKHIRYTHEQRTMETIETLKRERF